MKGNEIDEHFADKPLGYTETLVTERDDGSGGKVSFLIHCQKDDGYVTKMMSTHGILTPENDKQTMRILADGSRVTFQYPLPIARHNSAKHWVDDHNNRRHAPFSISDSWQTKWWPNRQFQLYVALAEINGNNARARARRSPPDPQLDFRKSLSCLMMKCDWDDDGNLVREVERPQTRSFDVRSANHQLVNRPKNTSIWLGNKWKKAKFEYHTTKCSCGFFCRTYCTCNKYKTLCKHCFPMHFAIVGCSD